MVIRPRVLNSVSTVCLRSYTKKKFPKAVHKIKDTLDYIHSDCWDPSKVELLKGHRYLVYMIDEYSRKT